MQKAAAYKKVVFEKFMKKDFTILRRRFHPSISTFCVPLSKRRATGSSCCVRGYRRVDEGLKYVNNDACYPSILVTGS